MNAMTQQMIDGARIARPTLRYYAGRPASVGQGTSERTTENRKWFSGKYSVIRRGISRVTRRERGPRALSEGWARLQEKVESASFFDPFGTRPGTVTV